MELALVRSLMDSDFYEDHRGGRCPDKLFSADVRKIKRSIDSAMDRYNRSVTPDEIEALFMSDNPTMTTAQKQAYSDLFRKIKSEQPLGSDIAGEVLSKLFQQVVGNEVASIGVDMINGTAGTLENLRNLLEQYGDDFIPTMNVEWDDISFESLIAAADVESRWKFNIPPLVRKVEGVSGGHLIEVGARPNTGKTSWHASMIAGPNGFARQGAKCIVLCNEESSKRVGNRYLSAASGLPIDQIVKDPNVQKEAMRRYHEVYDNIRIKECISRDMNYVEAIAKSANPDILVLDMGDKFKSGTHAREDLALRECAVHARQIAKVYDCAVFYMSQLSADAEGRTTLNQSMMEGSRTGKAAEADLMILIGKNAAVEGEEEESPQRHLNIAKNKLSGWHGRIPVQLDYRTARYEA
jgi:hypothetical protein